MGGEGERIMVDLQRPRVTLLDGFALDPGLDAVPVGELPHGVQRLVAHLGLAGRSPRTAVAGLLWPDVPERHAQGSLRSALWRLHRAVPGLVDAAGSTLSLGTHVQVDVQELAEWARQVLAQGPGAGPVEVPAGVLGGVLGGELLPGWYDDWVLLERERLRQLLVHTLEVAATRFAASGRYAEALQAAYAALRAEPLRESAHRVIVQVHLDEGNVAEALRAFDRCRVLLADELGVGPTDQMCRLVGGFRRRQPVAARSAGPVRAG
jgi:DNA-binding SARP family transcriptional activator